MAAVSRPIPSAPFVLRTIPAWDDPLERADFALVNAPRTPETSELLEVMEVLVAEVMNWRSGFYRREGHESDS